jgi:regulator of sirC expression with transglutaminase-like and TPR domain
MFAELVARPEPDLPLDRAALLIACHAYPDLDVDVAIDGLDALARGCREPTLDGLRRHLFGELGFVGNRTNYYDPRNSYLNDVLERRQGIPITLAVVCLAVGRRLGVPLAGVGMPGLFLLRDQVDQGVFVDPFAGGRLLDRDGCRRAFHAAHGPDAPFDEAFLDPVGPRAILARMLANLRAVYAALADHQALIWVLRLRTSIPGVALSERAELAAALGATGAYGEAAIVFEDLAATTTGAEADQLRQHASGLRARLN